MRLRCRCEGWLVTDEALESRARSFPKFDLKSTLLKVAAVNALYGTNVYAIARMAEHVEKLMQDRGSFSADVDLVERLASAPGLNRRFYSFAFAHFKGGAKSMARRRSSTSQARGLLYALARFLGDVSAVEKGKVARRAGRRLAGKATGRALSKLFK